ncbi:MAG: DUF885 domain-containing protein, partial [Pacificimonas sp.]|nr:DUF885 domain-containing protein [Pacificimonas sp.]
GGLLLVAGCQTQPDAKAAQTIPAVAAVDAAAQLSYLHDQMVEALLPYDLSLRSQKGEPIAILPPDSAEFWAGVANDGAAFGAALAGIDPAALNDDDALTHAYLLRLAESMEAYPDFWLYSFPVTPYAGGWRHNNIRISAMSSPLSTDEERARYLAAMRAYAEHIRSQRDKLVYQAEHGIRVARPAIPSARLVASNLEAAAEGLVPAPERLSAVPDAQRSAFQAAVEAVVEGEIKPAFRALRGVMDETYVEAAPERVGLMHQPGGAERYRAWTRLHTNTDLSPEIIHAIGQEILSDAKAELENIKADVGFEGTNREFAALVDADPRFSASTPDEVEAHFARAMERIKPELPRYFSLLPEAPYTVERAPPQVEQGMTFGYYRPPTPELPVGAYIYNGSQPESTSYANAAALIYHELLPGHHFQIALQVENEDLPLLRRANAFVPLTAYVEGWAEYAADLAGEMGMYRTPYERYGRLYSKMFLANRLVVDTGMNALGWSLAEAKAFMQANTFASEAEIDSELLRYSTDIPGQALAYAMGQRELLRMRDDARAVLGDAFTFPAFHAEVLAPGSLPMDLLDARLKAWSGQE